MWLSVVGIDIRVRDYTKVMLGWLGWLTRLGGLSSAARQAKGSNAAVGRLGGSGPRLGRQSMPTANSRVEGRERERGVI